MSKRKETIYIFITLAAGLVSFVSARMSVLSKQNQVDAVSQTWLQNEPPSVAEAEAGFDDEISQLLSNLKGLQSNLLTVLEDPLTSDESILEQVDSVNKAHEHIIRLVGQHVVGLRHELGETNREKLMQFCAEAVSEPMRRLGARMGGQAGQGQAGRGNRYGQRNRGGRGYGYRGGTGQAGQGYGQRFRFWNRMANRLRLTPEQVTELQQNDPNFESESTELYDNLSAQRQKLLALFEDPQSSDTELLEQIDNLVLAHSTAERKIAQHVLALRPYLTIEQQEWLIGLCRGFQAGK
ncbi:MAG: hypothetical protein P8016_16785 [Sedimentisphaerales bacterium]